MVDTGMNEMLAGAPPRETIGTVQPPARRTTEELLQQPIALPTCDTAWINNISWDIHDHAVATLRVNMVVNSAGSTPIQPGDGFATDVDGNREALTFRPCASTTNITSQMQVTTGELAIRDGEWFTNHLVQCISDNLTMELTSMAGETTDSNVWNNWCGRQRLLTSASSGSVTVTNTSTSATTGLINYGGIFDDQLTTAATNAWSDPRWIQAEHTRAFSDGLTAAILPRAQRQMETPEQRQEREEREVRTAAERSAAYEERQRVQRLKDAERRKDLEEATERAKRLLTSMLSEEQAHELETKRCFHLSVIDGKSGESKRYRIDQGYQGNVKLLGPDGRPIKSYCIHARATDEEGRRLPNEDHMLAQKLLLECNESEFLRIANASNVR